eukprot:357031-Chlamydomonas_euryale.AAC.1
MVTPGTQMFVWPDSVTRPCALLTCGAYTDAGRHPSDIVLALAVPPPPEFVATYMPPRPLGTAGDSGRGEPAGGDTGFGCGGGSGSRGGAAGLAQRLPSAVYFSVRGPVSLAALMSTGDFDGDE